MRKKAAGPDIEDITHTSSLPSKGDNNRKTHDIGKIIGGIIALIVVMHMIGFIDTVRDNAEGNRDYCNQWHQDIERQRGEYDSQMFGWPEDQLYGFNSWLRLTITGDGLADPIYMKKRIEKIIHLNDIQG